VVQSLRPQLPIATKYPQPSDSIRPILTEEFGGTLTVKGRVIGIIEEVSPRMIPEVLPVEVIRMSG